MLSAEAFALGHLVIVAGSLVALVVFEHRSRQSRTRWHRDVRYKQLTTQAVMKRLAKDRR